MAATLAEDPKPGKVYGVFTYLRRTHYYKRGSRYYVFRCQCGHEELVTCVPNHKLNTCKICRRSIKKENEND